MSTRFGACVARARLHARFGNPMPTNTTSPSDSSRAARTAISSRLEYVLPRSEYVVPRSRARGDSEAVVDSFAHARFGGQPCDDVFAQFVDVLSAAADSIDPLVEPRLKALCVARDRILAT